MFSIRHVPANGWIVEFDGEEWSLVYYEDALTAIDVIAMWFPRQAAIVKSQLKCECCGKKNGVESVVISPLADMLQCKACRDLPEYHPEPEGFLPKKSKKSFVVREPTHQQFIATMKAQAIQADKVLGWTTTGSDTMDRELKLPNAPLGDRSCLDHIPKEYAPTECQLCGTGIEEAFVDGAVKRAGCWGSMCLKCHKREGIGLGTGRGQLYVFDPATGDFTKARG